MNRCHWVNADSELYKKYHDEEWGVPVYNDDRLLFETLILETFQTGLSWLTVLKKREAFRQAYDNFDVQKVSAYNQEKIQQLFENPSIIRNKKRGGSSCGCAGCSGCSSACACGDKRKNP